MERQRERGRWEALATGREPLIEAPLWPEAAASEEVSREQPIRERVPRPELPIPPPARTPHIRHALINELTSRGALRRAILLHEVLGPPRSLQP